MLKDLINAIPTSRGIYIYIHIYMDFSIYACIYIYILHYTYIYVKYMFVCMHALIFIDGFIVNLLLF